MTLMKKEILVFAVFVGIILILWPTAPLWSSLWIERLIFVAYSIIIFVILKKTGRITQEDRAIEDNATKKQSKFFKYLLLASVVILIITRLIPFIHWGETPLGYDTGFYLMRINLEETKGVYSLFQILLKRIGLDPLTILHATYILLNISIAGSLYILQKSINKRHTILIGIISIFLFSISITQFRSYWWMIAHQNVAMSLLVLTIALLFTKPFLAIIPLLSGILIHIPTFIPLLLAIPIIIIVNLAKRILFKIKLEKYILYLIILFVIALTIVLIVEYDMILLRFKNYILENKFLTTNMPTWKVEEEKGAFLPSSFIYYTDMVIIPFAIFGLLKNRYKTANQTLLISVIAVILLAFSYFPVIYQNRFSIIFDLFLIVIASPQIFIFFTFLAQTKTKKIILTMLVMLMFAQITLVSWAQPSQITKTELNELKAVGVSTEKEARIMATDSFYTPWVYAFSNRITIGPGYLNDSWDLDKWKEFWAGKNYEEKQKLLKEPSHPLYIFIGDKQPKLEFIKFIKTDPSFTQISQHIWKHTLNNAKSN